jgi:cell division protein FtsQ
MARKIDDRMGLLPGLEEDSRPALKPRARSAATATPRREIATWRVVTIVTAIVMVALASLYALHRLEQFLVRDPRFALNGPEGSLETASLEIAGATHASERQVEAVFAEDSGRSVYLLPMGERRNALRSVDWVKDASLVRLWPNRVVVRIAERKPVAFIALSSSRFGLIDEDGVILPPAQDRFEVPVLAGIRASDPLPQRRDRVHRMMRLTRDIGDLGAKISQIDVADPDNLRVTQPWEGRVVTLLLGDRNFSLRYQNFIRNYPEIKRRLPDATKLDMRLEDRITVVE